MDNCEDDSGRICGIELLDSFIEDVRNTKKTLFSKMESVMSLIKEVECEEKAAEQAKKEADQSSYDILVKVDECKQVQRLAEETNDMLVRKVCVQKAVLATKMEVLKLCMSHLLDDADGSLAVLDEMHRALEMKLASVVTKKELANKKKQENESFSQLALAYEETLTEKLVKEFKRLKQEALENSKLQEILVNHGHVVDTLHGEISDKCQDVSLLKEGFDQSIPLTRTSSMLAQTHDEGVALQSTIKSNDFDERIKKVKIKDKLHRNQFFAKNMKGVKIKGLRVVSKKRETADH